MYVSIKVTRFNKTQIFLICYLIDFIFFEEKLIIRFFKIEMPAIAKIESYVLIYKSLKNFVYFWQIFINHVIFTDKFCVVKEDGCQLFTLARQVANEGKKKQGSKNLP